jgi:hypothetical protein
VSRFKAVQHIVGGSFLENEIKKEKVETAELEKTLEVHCMFG